MPTTIRIFPISIGGKSFDMVKWSSVCWSCIVFSSWNQSTTTINYYYCPLFIVHIIIHNWINRSSSFFLECIHFRRFICRKYFESRIFHKEDDNYHYYCSILCHLHWSPWLCMHWIFRFVDFVQKIWIYRLFFVLLLLLNLELLSNSNEMKRLRNMSPLLYVI